MLGIKETKLYLTFNFKMKNLCEVNTILGIKISKHDNDFSMNQSYYINKLLTKYNYIGIKEATTPYHSSMKLAKNEGKVVAQLEYTSAIGSLMYVLHCTRPDIAFIICKLARFTNKPSMDHWKAIDRVLNYLKKTMC
ncbi:Retrovirus-related Pol polyprotein from transposon TNT 1-94 [Apostasia shenzhenica]|uniref:Retrovirus-related Pol polyprotein from transposon TNT 1-94 n=1 Tax=Apostasia shenzhenica TaxID=1088818 RepID=A0A2I0AGG5_9ASPA|nr:Retrovirus-related Pol polyprotein from transposon TNT 1-94 [Apostasia shenzhenica]